MTFWDFYAAHPAYAIVAMVIGMMSMAAFGPLVVVRRGKPVTAKDGEK